MFDVSSGAPPRILEIGHIPYMHSAFPESTEFYSTSPEERLLDPARGKRIVSLSTLPGLMRRLTSPDFDLVVVHPSQFPPWSMRALIRALFRRSVLRGSVPLVRGFGPQLLRGRVTAPVAILDLDDPAVIDRSNMF